MTSLQILHSDVQFTAADMIDLDFKLIFAVIGTLTAYLIILIQFNSNDNAMCDFVNVVKVLNVTN